MDMRSRFKRDCSQISGQKVAILLRVEHTLPNSLNITEQALGSGPVGFTLQAPKQVLMCIIFTPKASDTLKIGYDLLGSFSRAVEESRIPFHSK
jgi:hypothetical protein